MSTVPNYLRDVLKVLPTLTPGTGTVIEVLHDSWCAHYRGRPCDCDRELVVHREAADDDPRPKESTDDH